MPAAPQEQCPLCGRAFDAKGCRPSCPMSAGCHVVCCPNCGYGFPQEHRGLAGLIQRALVRIRRQP
jgi:hypothetical protein